MKKIIEKIKIIWKSRFLFFCTDGLFAEWHGAYRTSRRAHDDSITAAASPIFHHLFKRES